MFDINNGIEDIKRRDKIAVLDREFPGGSCGNTECENLCAEALHIAKAMRLDPKTMIEDSIRQGIAPQTHCVPASAELTLPFFTAPCRFGFVRPNDHLALSESSNDSSYVFRAKPGACEKCQSCDGITIPADKMQDEKFMKNFGFWKQKDGVFRPHPNCDCKWVKTNVYENATEKAETKNSLYDRYHSELKRGEGHDLYFRKTGAPGKYGVFGGGTTFDGIDDLLDKLDKGKYLPHSVDRIIITSHSGIDGLFDMGKGDDLRNISAKQIERLKKFLNPDSVLDLRMCSAISGDYGQKTAQKLANELGCKVLGYEGPVSTQGGRSPIVPKDPDVKIPLNKRIMPDPKPKLFFPKLESNGK